MTSSTQTDTNSFDQLLERLPSDPNAKGKAFEQVCKWFLQTDPAYANELNNVWTWGEWPQRWGPDIGQTWQAVFEASTKLRCTIREATISATNQTKRNLEVNRVDFI